MTEKKPCKSKISVLNILLLIPVLIALIFFGLCMGTFITGIFWGDQSSAYGSNWSLNQSDSFSVSMPADNQTIRNITLVKGIVKNYHATYPCNGSGMSVYGKRATEVWNRVHLQGINAVILVGNIDQDISSINDMDYVWVLAETSRNQWIALDTYGGFLVCNNTDFCPVYNLRYYRGMSFKTPAELKNASELLTHKCPDGFIYGNDEKCHLMCGRNMYCTGDAMCINDQCKIPVPAFFWEKK